MGGKWGGRGAISLLSLPYGTKQINTIQVHRWNLDNFITLYNILISPYFSNTYFWFLAQFEFSGIFYAISYDISKDKSKDLVRASKFSLIILSIPSPPLLSPFCFTGYHSKSLLWERPLRKDPSLCGPQTLLNSVVQNQFALDLFYIYYPGNKFLLNILPILTKLYKS